MLPGIAVFGASFYAKGLDVVIAEYGITTHYSRDLVAVDGARKVATFEQTQGTEKARVDMPFDLLHAVPPQSAPDFIKTSPLADASGWVAVDKNSLQHTTYKNVFGLGDCTNTLNSKTAATVPARAPILVSNLLDALHGHARTHAYDGYASCPLTTSIGRIMLAEFGYDGTNHAEFPTRSPRATANELVVEAVLSAEALLADGEHRAWPRLAPQALLC
jgi:sulfide:quinone oxidoreductase